MKGKQLKGIGGWLILLIIILVVHSYGYLYDIYLSIEYYLILNESIFFIISLINFGILIPYIYGLISLFQHKKKAIWLIILALWLNVLMCELIFLLVPDSLSIKMIIGSIAGALTWTLYFDNSKRVKNTLVN